MNLPKTLLQQEKINTYFNQENIENWRKNYEKKIESINHDETWLTLMALYSIFGDQSDLLNHDVLNAFNVVLDDSGFNSELYMKEIKSIQIEKVLPEIKKYNLLLYNIAKNSDDKFHLYPDRIESIKNKVHNRCANLEGNTNLDVEITGTNHEGEQVLIYTEAKFLSDISKDTTYNPVRDQIIRNIDNGIELIIDEKLKAENFYFLLLTPAVFRPTTFGRHSKNALNVFDPTRSRLYCYKMNEYKNGDNLASMLPHRNLSVKQWQSIADNIGWITFDTMILAAINNNTLDTEHKNEIIQFFGDRNLFKEQSNSFSNRIKIKTPSIPKKKEPVKEISNKELCPDCSEAVIDESGCKYCRNCGWSACAI